jgi:indolepyruvate ferredoxin oxidoreductase alpha subunit
MLALLQEAAAELGQRPILIGDPGCWVKVAGELDGKFAIGSAVAVASGLLKAGVEERVVALFGDSAYFHSALPAICNAAYNRSGVFMLLLDNGGAVSTGAQPTPASGVDALGNPAPRLNIPEIARACGVPDVLRIPLGASEGEIKAALRAGLEERGLILLVLEVEISPEFT